MTLTYQKGVCNTEFARLRSVIRCQLGIGAINDQEFVMLRRNLDGGFYQYVRDKLNEILDD